MLPSSTVNTVKVVFVDNTSKNTGCETGLITALEKKKLKESCTPLAVHFIKSVTTPPPWISLVFGFSVFLLLSYTHIHYSLTICFSLREGEDGESQSVQSRSKDARRRTGSFWAPALKTNCDKVSVCNESVEIGPGMLDYLLRLAPTYRERNY